ncbi:TraR/DksA family transcriptional regulator [Streptomyces sp. NPDC090994]|uniref:TraR/DksA family transcriptional regulator n=1 Tax=Streptomyces sp. NPDC090994 TaxID=3365969 RepID=UPI0037FB4E40
MVNHQTIGDGALHLSPEDLAELRRNLCEQRDPARRPAAPGRAPVPLSASTRMVLADVRAALQRIDEGRYGICHLCRRPVGRDRLMVVEQARYCARCRHVREPGR